MSEPTNTELAAHMRDDADFLEKEFAWDTIPGHLRLAAQRLEGEIIAVQVAAAEMTERLIQAAVDYERATGIYSAGARRELNEAREAIERVLASSMRGATQP
jgi:hypothetical protein